MAILSAANFEALTDSICAQYQQYASVIAALGTTATNPSAPYGAQQNLGRILALNDAQEILALLAAANALPGSIALPSYASFYQTFIQALNQHVGGIDAYLTSNAIQVGQEFAQMARANGQKLTPANVFSALVASAATFVASGAGAGTYAAGSSIDPTLYAGNAAQLVLTATQGASSGTYTVTLNLAAGGTQQETQAVPGSTTSGTSYNLAGGAAYVGIANITYTGGQSGDACKIVLPRLRAATL